GTNQPVSMSTQNFSYRYQAEQSGRTYSFTHSIGFLRPQVPPGEVLEHLDRLSKVRAQLSREVRLPLFDPSALQAEFVAAAGREQQKIYTALGSARPELRAAMESSRQDRLRALAARMRNEAAIKSGQLGGELLAGAWVDVAIARSQLGDRPSAL